MRKFIAVFYDDRGAPTDPNAYVCREVDIAEKWLDDPLGYIAHTRPQEHIHVVLCVVAEGLDALLESVRNREK